MTDLIRTIDHAALDTVTGGMDITTAKILVKDAIGGLKGKFQFNLPITTGNDNSVNSGDGHQDL